MTAGLGTAVLLLVGGCSASPRASTPAAPATALAPPSPTPLSPAEPPPLPVPGKILYQAAAQHASAGTTALPELQPGTVGVTAVCSGPGSIEVALSGIFSYTVVCGSSAPSDYNEYTLNAPRPSVSLSVQGQAGDEWAVTVGWNAATADPVG